MLQTILDWLLPQQCCLCSRFTPKHVCEACLGSITQKPVRYEHLNELDFVISYFEYAGSFQKLMHALKFQKIKPIANLLASKIDFSEIQNSKADYWVPVVGYKTRLKKRGFNPVDLIFESRVTGKYLKLGIERIKDTPFLHTLSAQERLDVLDQAFLWRGPDIKGKTMIILDDIFTTGATVSTIAKMLKNEGAKSVGVVTLAYVVLKGHK